MTTLHDARPFKVAGRRLSPWETCDGWCAARRSSCRSQPAEDAGFALVTILTPAFGMNRLLSSLLFGVRPSDPVTIVAVVTLISAVALVACYLPARMATRVDPMIVLREE